MQNHSAARRESLPNRPGFTLIECAIAVLLVGVLMVAALQSVGASKRREAATVDRLLGQQLASALLNEILLQTYAEPDTTQASVFGPEPGDTTGNRSLFDDVDDYHGWAATPPTDRSGTAIPGFTGWTQSVSVVWANPTTLQQTTSSNTGLKKITVTVSKGSKTLGSLVGYRSIAWVDTIPAPTDTTGNHPPVAVAVVTSAGGLNKLIGETMTFSGTSSNDQDSDSLSYVWNFGDGTTGAGSTINHVYSAAGNYSCTLTVYDGRGGVGTSVLAPVITP